MTTLDVLAWICIENRQVLCARTKGNEVFYLPGGKRETGESDWEGLSREVQEEMSVALMQRTLVHALTVEEKAHGFVEPTWVTMKCFMAEYEGAIVPAAEIESIAWLTTINLQQCAPATQRVLEHLASQQLID
ncbi:MAG: NUDIX domain-containing protein [Cyanobacteria bacterium P01_A01_bin.17]